MESYHIEYLDDDDYSLIENIENSSDLSGEKVETKRKYTKCDPQNLELAVQAVKEGMSYRSACESFQVPQTTLYNRIKGKPARKKGSLKTVFTQEEEAAICDWIFINSEHGFPRTKNDIIRVASQMRDRKFGMSYPNLLTEKWFQGFMSRNPAVAFRTPQSVTRASANVTKDDLKKFFDNVNNYIDKEGLNHNKSDSRRFLNLDETGYEYNPKPKKVLAKKGSKSVSF
jgi:hypothetical protein